MAVQPMTDPYEPPQARELAVPPLPPDLGRRGAAWFGLTALAGMVILLGWLLATSAQPTTRDVLVMAIFMAVMVSQCAAVGFFIGSRCLEPGWLRFLLLAGAAGLLWTVAAVATLLFLVVFFDLSNSAPSLPRFARGTLTTSKLLVPLTLALSIALRGWATRGR
jgi:hypothetical protein